MNMMSYDENTVQGLVDNRSLDMFRIANSVKYYHLFFTIIYLVLLIHLFFMTHNFLIFYSYKK
jgi:hypothetical protein